MTKEPRKDPPAGPALEADEAELARTGARTTLITSIAVGLSSMAFNVWWPFMPLYVLELGATSDANALFWVAVATTSQGVARLVTSPIWGLLADRFGRKMMFLRTLYLASFTFVAAAVVEEPWQLALALAIQGVFSGFVGPSIALISVSVPDSSMSKSMSRVTGVQYIGTTLGPALGAVLATVIGFRGSILAAAILPLVAGLAVHIFVPRDRTTRVARGGNASEGREKEADRLGLEPFRITFQFSLAVFMFTILFALNQLIRFITPIALRAIENRDDVEALSGLAFTLGSGVAAFSVLVLAPRFFTTGRLRKALAMSCAIGCAGMALLALAGGVSLYLAGFLLTALVLAAMVPATNALIAANVTRSRRGTAFGIASSAQAVALLVGPSAAAVFAAISLSLGFAILAGILALMGVAMFTLLREPGGPTASH